MKKNISKITLKTDKIVSLSAGKMHGIVGARPPMSGEQCPVYTKEGDTVC